MTIQSPFTAPVKAGVIPSSSVARFQPANQLQSGSSDKKETSATAIVYCEGNFGGIDGKTANGLVRHSQRYQILSIIDSDKAGRDAGYVLDEEPNGIPIHRDLTEALEKADGFPDYFIFGIAPASGMLSPTERGIVLRAIHCGMNIVNGLHEFLNDDPEFAAAAARSNVVIRDVRRPRDKKDLRVFSGRIAEVTCPRIAVLGTDCAIGKRTTATVITRALLDRGIKAVMIGTGQTGLMQGARYGIALDAVPSQFCAGELEATILDAFEGEDPDVIFIEGQGSLSHPAYSTSSFIIRGSCPDGVILQHAPKRFYRCDFEHMPMPTPASEIHLIETFANTKVIGLTINHEHMTDGEVSSAITQYEKELEIPVTDALTRSSEVLVEMVLAAFPQIGGQVSAEVA
ncbi:MAG: DUF1611 domain-containing protein [Verrucomicrobiales bacterium]|nr:DUF1611 domain-containing protein [Verrucomicrobiales bacterium]